MLDLPRPWWCAWVPVSGVVMIGYTIARIVKPFVPSTVKE
jgi:hypothetical protein